jgi:hypothetical protein
VSYKLKLTTEDNKFVIIDNLIISLELYNSMKLFNIIGMKLYFMAIYDKGEKVAP